jgi:maspardin
MRSKLKWIIPFTLLVILVAVYLFPLPRQSFDELSADVPERQRLEYQGFKNQFTPHRLVVDGVTWEYIAAGPDREAILFLHGMTGAYDIWWQQILALRQEYKFISVTYPALDSLEELSQGIIAILEAERISTVSIVGTSLGGYLAQYLVARYPERITRVIFGNTFPPNDIIRQNNSTLGSLLPFLPEWSILRTLQRSIEERVYPASGNDAFTRAYLIELVSSRVSKAQLVSRYQTVIEPFNPSDPLALGIPVMIIESDNDPLVEESLRLLLKQTYPFSQVNTFSGAGHFPYLNRAEEFNNLLLRFLKQPRME